MSDLASWVEAIGTVGTVVTAVFLWRADRARERLETARTEKERVERMIVALWAEIDCTLKAARRQKITLDQTLATIEKAVAKGAEVTGNDTVVPESLRVTDSVVYRALAPEIGRLPPEIIRQTTEFYAPVTWSGLR